MKKSRRSLEEERAKAVELLSDPVHRHTVKTLVCQALAKLEPDQVEASKALIEPLMDRTARGEPLEPNPGTLRGGFGGTELAVLALVPLTLHAVAHLLQLFGRDWPAEVAKRGAGRTGGETTLFALSLDEAEVLVRASGASAVSPETLELVGAVHEAILAHAEQVAGGVRPGTRRRMPFQDFPVRIDTHAEKWVPRLLPASGDARPVLIPPPWSQPQLPATLRDLELLARSTARNLTRLDGFLRDGPPAEVLGGALFDALFAGGLRDAYEYRRAAARSRGEGFRIRLIFDPEETGPALVPWELLYDRRSGHFLSLDPLTPVVRQLIAPAPTDPRPASTVPPLRLLVASALPRDVTSLDAEQECRRIEASLQDRKDIETQVVHQATVRGLRRELRELSPHVLHFIGHGAFPRATEEAAALFVGPDDASDPMLGNGLAAVLQGLVDLRLVVLNSCNSGALPRRCGRDAFSGLAAALVRGGCPAVVAMQFPITDPAAIAFGDALYEALGAGDPVEGAVTEGRQAVFDLDRRSGSFEWATPVLYLGVEAGDLFHFQTPG